MQGLKNIYRLLILSYALAALCGLLSVVFAASYFGNSYVVHKRVTALALESRELVEVRGQLHSLSQQVRQTKGKPTGSLGWSQSDIIRAGELRQRLAKLQSEPIAWSANLDELELQMQQALEGVAAAQLRALEDIADHVGRYQIEAIVLGGLFLLFGVILPLALIHRVHSWMKSWRLQLEESLTQWIRRFKLTNSDAKMKGFKDPWLWVDLALLAIKTTLQLKRRTWTASALEILDIVQSTLRDTPPPPGQETTAEPMANTSSDLSASASPSSSVRS